jgi:hypothetical protein
MKTYVFYTPSYEVLLKEWFLPSANNYFDLAIRKGDEPSGTSADYKLHGWTEITKQKTEFIIEAIRDNWGKLFVFSDPDILFFQDPKKALFKNYVNQDILFQRNSAGGALCSGFFLCKGSHKTLRLWKLISKLVGRHNRDDQDALNCLLFNKYAYVDNILNSLSWYRGRAFMVGLSEIGMNICGLRWGYLTLEFANFGTLRMREWFPGESFPVQKGTIMFHANWTTGLNNKIALLKFVKDYVEKNRGI